MNLKCLLRGHRAAAAAVYNSGFYFSRCTGCDADMLRLAGTWQTIPPGHRVVWKATPSNHSMEATFEGHLPVLHRDSEILEVRAPRPSWSRALVAVRQKSPRADSQGVEEEAPPSLFLVVALWAGLQLLAAVRPRSTARL